MVCTALEVLLEPETTYRVVNVEENKPECHGFTWITVEVVETPPIIEDVIRKATDAKESKIAFVFSCVVFFSHNFLFTCVLVCFVHQER